MAFLSLQVKHGSQMISIVDQLTEQSTLLELQEAIEKATGVMARKQKLICKGKVLTSLPLQKTTLSAANVGNFAKIMLLTSSTGGPSQSQGATALQEAQKAKMDALKERLKTNNRPTSKNSSSQTAAAASTASTTISTRIGAWSKTGIAALRDLKLIEIPTEIFTNPLCCDTIRVLDLGGNNFSELSPSISNLKNLQKLRLSFNVLTDNGMPWKEISSMTHLIVLALDHNKLTVVPGCLSTLTNLQKLTLDHNAITNLPETELFSGVVNLKALTLNSNCLTTIPSSLSECSLLEELNLSMNKISKIPIEFGKLTALKTLLLDDNKISCIPSELLIHATSLSTLSVHNCPITVETFRETRGFEEFEARRRLKYDKQVNMKVLGQGSGFDEGVDVQEWEHWKN